MRGVFSEWTKWRLRHIWGFSLIKLCKNYHLAEAVSTTDNNKYMSRISLEDTLITNVATGVYYEDGLYFVNS